MGVLRHLRAHVFVALQAGLVAPHSLAELVISPLLDRFGASLFLVHGMAGHAAHGFFVRVVVRIAGAVHQAAVFPAGDPDHPV